MNIPIDKNKNWVAGLHESIDKLDQDLKLAIIVQHFKQVLAARDS